MSEQSNKPSPQQARAASPNPSASAQRDGRRRERGERQERAPRAEAAPFRNPIPAITFPEDLPVSSRRAEIAKAVQENQVVIVSGETGSGGRQAIRRK